MPRVVSSQKQRVFVSKSKSKSKSSGKVGLKPKK